jgi:hypothetical protein
MKHTSLWLAGLLVATVLPARAATFFVATNGNDGWTGRLERPNRQGGDGPFATLPAAIQAARAARRATPGEAVSVFLRGGTHVLNEPLTLSPGDSGVDAKKPFLIAAYRNEHPVISGGRRVTGWRKSASRPELWEAEVPEVREGKWYFHQLFVDGRRATRARTPNDGFFRIQGASPQDKPVKIKFAPGDIRKEWADDGDVELRAFLSWADIRMQIRSVDETNHVATLSGDPRPSNQEANARYFIENAPDALDQPGEWYLNRRTGVVAYCPRPGEDMTRAEVIAPRLSDLVVMRGDFGAKNPVRHVTLRGLTFSHTDWELGRDGYADTQAAIATHGDILGEAAVDCVVEDCVFSHLAGYAIEAGRGCQHWKITGNEMFDLGGGGVRLGEPEKRTESFEQSSGHVVTDNHLHDLGVVYPPAVGVFVLQSGNNRIAHNHIHHLYYTAVSVGWNWGYQETPCHDNVVEFNHMHHIGQDMLSDMGAVYTLGIQHGTVVRNNLIHDVSAFTYGGWGLYPDEGSTGLVWENNVVYRCKSAGFHQHYGRENLVRNNVFAFNREHQIMRTRAEAHTSFFFTNNIVLFNSGDLLGSNWSNDHYIMDRNVYFDTRLRENPAALKFSGATLDQWRQRDHDTHSIIADPLFIDPEMNDFRLRNDSPALKLGFRPIDLRSVGVRKKSDRH